MIAAQILVIVDRLGTKRALLKAGMKKKLHRANRYAQVPSRVNIALGTLSGLHDKLVRKFEAASETFSAKEQTLVSFRLIATADRSDTIFHEQRRADACLVLLLPDATL